MDKSAELNEEIVLEEKSDIEEEEQGNDQLATSDPFDPSKINIKIMTSTIGQLVDRLNYKEILIPKYQRVPNLWKEKKKSRFIESLMLNLPIPLFYFDNQEDSIWRVVDGLQRVSTIEHFISEEYSIANNKSPLILNDLEFLTDYNGKTWQDLPREMQRRIKEFQITINLIDKGTPEEVKYNIFSRINQGGVPLKAQEIRTAIFQGYKSELLEFLVSKENDCGRSFHRAVSNSVKTSRQDDLDFANRFVSFYLLGYQSYEPDMDTFLTKGLKALKNEISEINHIKERFQFSMELSYSLFQNDAFRKRTNIDDPRKPINRPLFETISLSLANLRNDLSEKLTNKREEFTNDFILLQKKDDFWRSITSGTATKESVLKRHSMFNDLIKKYDT